MHYDVHDFRRAEEILSGRDAWHGLHRELSDLSAQEIIDAHLGYGIEGKRIPTGGQSALNKEFRTRLTPLGWEPQPRLFDDIEVNPGNDPDDT